MLYNPAKSTWLNPNIEYLFNNEIIEYDMKDAGFTIVKFYKLVPPEEIKRLERLEKGERNRAIGKLQIGNKELSKALSDKFAEMRTLFVSANKLTDDDIISVKKDAIFTIGPCQQIKFGKVEFSAKNRYSSYLRLTENMNIELYYADGEIDVKGIGDHGINRHRLYFLTFFQKLFSDLESKNVSLKRYIKKFVDDYKGGNLDPEFYVEFNNMSRDVNPMYNFQKVIIPIIQLILREMS